VNPHLTLAVNMGMVPGVTSTGLEHRPDGTVIVTVHGGNPMTVARMILSCLPPGTETGGETLVEVDGVVVRLNHVDPTLEQPEDFVAPLPLVTPEGRHEPMGVKPPSEAAEGPGFPSRIAVLVVAGAVLLGAFALWWLLHL
jgi:hypothetical protein